MKKAFALLVAGVFTFALIGCSSSSSPTGSTSSTVTAVKETKTDTGSKKEMSTETKKS